MSEKPDGFEPEQPPQPTAPSAHRIVPVRSPRQGGYRVGESLRAPGPKPDKPVAETGAEHPESLETPETNTDAEGADKGSVVLDGAGVIKPPQEGVNDPHDDATEAQGVPSGPGAVPGMGDHAYTLLPTVGAEALGPVDREGPNQ